MGWGGSPSGRGGSPSRGVLHPGGMASQHALRQTPSPPVDRITDTCKNITLATTSLRPVINFNIAFMVTQTQTQRMGLSPFSTFCVCVKLQTLTLTLSVNGLFTDIWLWCCRQRSARRDSDNEHSDAPNSRLNERNAKRNAPNYAPRGPPKRPRYL